jgi:hypothetical protein
MTREAERKKEICEDILNALDVLVPGKVSTVAR